LQGDVESRSLSAFWLVYKWQCDIECKIKLLRELIEETELSEVSALWRYTNLIVRPIIRNRTFVISISRI